MYKSSSRNQFYWLPQGKVRSYLGQAIKHRNPSNSVKPSCQNLMLTVHCMGCWGKMAMLDGELLIDEWAFLLFYYEPRFLPIRSSFFLYLYKCSVITLLRDYIVAVPIGLAFLCGNHIIINKAIQVTWKVLIFITGKLKKNMIKITQFY